MPDSTGRTPATTPPKAAELTERDKPADPSTPDDEKFRFFTADTPEQIAALIERDAAAGDVTPADVRQAEQDAKDAAALVDALEEQVIDGDDEITADEIEAQRKLSGFAKLRAQATARKAERAARAARLKKCDELRAEIEAYATDTGERYVALLQAAEDAVAAFTDAVRDRNTQLDQWRHRMVELQIPKHGNPLVPPAEHAHLGLNGKQVIAGRRRLDKVDPGAWLGRMLARVASAHHPVRGMDMDTGTAFGQFTVPPANPGDHYAKLARVDAPVGDPPDNIRFFLTTGGGVIEMDHEPNEIEARGIVREISRREAWGR